MPPWRSGTGQTWWVLAGPGRHGRGLQSVTCCQRRLLPGLHCVRLLCTLHRGALLMRHLCCPPGRWASRLRWAARR